MTNETAKWSGRHDTAALASRIRKILAGRRSHMLCGAAKQGFMFRVGKAQHAKAIARRGASPVVMRGRDLEGFVWVSALPPKRRSR